VNLMAHVSRWLASQQPKPEELSAARVEEFLQARRAAGYTLELSQRGMVPLLVYLRRLGVIPIPAVRVARTEAERLIEEYRSYLVTERGLAASSVVAYLATARLFLSACEGKAGLAARARYDRALVATDAAMLEAKTSPPGLWTWRHSSCAVRGGF